MIIPAAVTGTAVLLLALGGLYTYVNRNKHVDNRYNLDFTPDAKINYNLYVSDDLPYVNQILGTNMTMSKTSTPPTATEVPLQFVSGSKNTHSSSASSKSNNDDPFELIVPNPQPPAASTTISTGSMTPQ